MAERNEEQFQIVGANYRTYTPRKEKPSFWRKMKGKPLFSLTVLAAIVLCCTFAGFLSNHDPGDFYLDNLNEAPNASYYFGTDSLGRDIYSMIWYGGRVSILIGMLSMVIITVIGVIYGCISGTANDKADAMMLRFAEIMNSIPSILLLLMLASMVGKLNILKISLVIGVTGWFALARIVRSEVRQIRNSEYVLAARCMGAGFLHIMQKHLIPNFISAILFVVISSISTSMSMESTLSFLGLGLPTHVISWGSMLSLANRALLSNTWWVIIIPGAFLLITLITITNIGNYFRKEVNKKASNL